MTNPPAPGCNVPAATDLGSARDGEGRRSDISWHQDSGSAPGDGPPQPTPQGQGWTGGPPSPQPPPPPPYGQPPYGGQPQYAQPQYPPPGWSPYAPPSRATNGLAIASLVCGLVWMWGVTSVLAVIFGLVGRRQIKERNESGDGMAIAGIVLGILGILGTIAMIILVVATVDDVDSYDEFENYDLMRARATMVWSETSAALAGLRSALPWG